jgi:hypothetical protein
MNRAAIRNVVLPIALLVICRVRAADDGPVGYWKLRGDARDYSGRGNHGENHGVELATSEFNGRDSFIDVPDSPALRFGTGDFTIATWIFTDNDFDDGFGDILAKFDPVRRTGFNLTIGASAAGYNSTGDARHIRFGIDDGAPGDWQDCGRPGGKTHNSDALTVFDGALYAGVTDAPDEGDWAHVFRFKGGQIWEDCGRVGHGRTRGVYAMIVHNGSLYAATSASHGRQPATMDFGRVYRYVDGQEWQDLGQPGSNHRLNALASFRGKLYVCGFNIGPEPGHVYVLEDDGQWRACGEFAGWPHTLAVHNGNLYTAYPKGEVFAFDGVAWRNLGNPFGSIEECNQIHSLGVFRGELHAGTWPKGKVAALRGDTWVDRGRLGDATEVIALAGYNGSLYAGTIPRAEVFRWDAGNRWTSIRRLFDPPRFVPVPVGSGDVRVADWSRTTSLTVFGGKLFASTGTCYRTMIDAPLTDDVRGRVFSLQAGANVSYDRDLGPGWQHIVALRDRRQLKLFVNGRLTASSAIQNEALKIDNDAPLRIGFGEVDYFSGKVGDVKLFNRALTDSEIQSLAAANYPK